VKSSIRFLSVIFLTAIYCLTIGVVTKSFANSVYEKYPASPQEKYIADLSAKLFCHTTQSEISINNISNLPVSNFKNPFTESRAILKAIEQLFKVEFSQYTLF